MDEEPKDVITLLFPPPIKSLHCPFAIFERPPPIKLQGLEAVFRVPPAIVAWQA